MKIEEVSSQNNYYTIENVVIPDRPLSLIVSGQQAGVQFQGLGVVSIIAKYTLIHNII